MNKPNVFAPNTPPSFLWKRNALLMLLQLKDFGFLPKTDNEEWDPAEYEDQQFEDWFFSVAEGIKNNCFTVSPE